MDRLECPDYHFAVDSTMDWRLQMTSLAMGGFLVFTPFLAVYHSVWDPATVSSWNFVASVMQYLLIGGIVIAVLGLLWQGRIGRESVLVQFGLSIGVGAVMFLVSLALAVYWFTWSESCPDPTLTRCFVASAEYPAATSLPLGLLIPALSFVSSIVWIIRHRAAFSVETASTSIS
jgi:hypothetical protein